MSGLSLLAPLGLIALVGVPAVILFHMRHSTPVERRVPTLRFWLAAQPEPAAQSRLRRPPISLLLLLQLLIVALLAFGLTRPATSRALGGLDLRTEPRHLILLLDGSTSMEATDTPSDRTRWDAARAIALDRVGALHGGDVATVVVLGTRTATLEATDAGSLRALRDRLANLRQPGGRADLNAALTLAKDLLLPHLDDRVVLVSDGALTADPGVVANLGAPIELVPVGGAGIGPDNVAITDLSARANPANPERQQLYVQAVNFTTHPVTAKLTLKADNLDVQSNDLTLQAGTAVPNTWDAPAGAAAVTVTLQITDQTTDALPADNTASLILHQTATQAQGANAADTGLGLKILLVSDNPTYLQRALAVLPGVNLTTETTDNPAAADTSQPYDLVVYDGFSPSADRLPKAPILFVHPPDNGPFPSKGPMTAPTVARVHADDPLLAGVDLAGVTFGDATVYTLAASQTEVVGADGGPLLFRGTLNGRANVVFAFDIAQSNLPRRVAFPILIANIANQLAPSPLPASVPLGDPLVYRPRADAASVRVTTPDGRSVDLSLAGSAAKGGTAPTATSGAGDERLREVDFADTGQPGVYTLAELDANGKQIGGGRFVVNAGHPSESDLRPDKYLPGTLATAHAAGDHGSAANLADLWPLLVAAALGVLTLEWLVALRPRRGARRVGGGRVAGGAMR